MPPDEFAGATMKIAIAACILVLGVSGAEAANLMTASDAAAKSDGGRVIYGTFAMTVQSTGGEHDLFFLNSDKDYHSPKNLSATLQPAALAELKKLHGNDLAAFFTGRTIWVTGEARRAPIIFVNNGSPTGQGYYQHRVYVSRASQISLMAPQ